MRAGRGFDSATYLEDSEKSDRNPLGPSAGTAVASYPNTHPHALRAPSEEEEIMAATDAKEDTGAPKVPPPVVMPPAPPGESSAAAVDRTRAVSQALAELGDDADAEKVADHIRATWGLSLSPDDIETLRRELRSHAQPGPPSPAGTTSGREGGP